MKKKITLLLSATTLSFFAIAQSFTATYDFAGILATTGVTDPSPVPTATGVTFGSFTYTGAQVNPNAAGRFSFTGWSIGATTAIDTYATYTGALDPANYYQVTITPNVSNTLSLSQITFDMRRSATGPRTYAVRSSADGYTTNLPASINPANANLTVETGNVFFWAFDATANNANQLGSTITLSGVPFTNSTSPVSFRIYAWNSEAVTGSFGVDNVTINGTATPSTSTVITTHPQDTAVCIGLGAGFTVASANATGYQWEENTGTIWTALSNTGVYSGVTTTSLIISDATGLNAFQYRCIASGTNNDTSNAATLTVLPTVIPNVTVSPASITVCEFDSAFAVATGINAGTNPTYDWYVAGIGQVDNGATITIGPGNVPPGTYSLICVLTSNAACASPTVDSSSVVTVTVMAAVIPVVTVSPASITLCELDSAFGVATGINAGTNPTYDWYVAGVGQVDSGDTISFSPGNVPAGTYSLICVLTSNATCALPAVDSSSIVTVTVNPSPVPDITQAGNVLSTTIPYSTYQWYFNSTALGTNATETALLSGNYEVEVSNAFGCFNISAPYAFTSIGINSVNTNDVSINVYPNPSNDGVFTISSTNTSKMSISVYNIIGKKIMNKEVAQGKQIIDLSAEANGSYFVTIKTENESITKKITINK